MSGFSIEAPCSTEYIIYTLAAGQTMCAIATYAGCNESKEVRNIIQFMEHIKLS